MNIRLLTCFVAAIAVAAPAANAWACGGFFCNAATQSPIYQAGERVVFAMHDDGVTMHIEIAYEGEPTDFGWIMPIEAPRDAQGAIKPLEEILYVSTADLFDALQQSTDPIYQATNTFEENSCQRPDNGVDVAQTFDSAGGDFASDSSGPVQPPVVVLQEANVGPYGAQLIQATDAAALYDWLELNGYIQDPAALPLLESYVDQELVFLGLRLQSGKSAGDIQPVQLELGETYACVPLRLTAIAATPDMPMLVWVLGPERAIPKNFLHAVVNPLALRWPGGSNYIDLVTDAVNSIAGRAFVTEYASDERMWNQRFWGPWHQDSLDALGRATTLQEVVAAIQNSTSLSSDSEMRTVVQGVLAMPDGLTGFPYGNCYLTPDFEEPIGSDGWGGEFQPCEPNEEHITTPAEFYGYLEFWIDELALRGTPLTVDIDVLRTAVIDGWFGPRERIQTMFDNAEWVTRFFTTISPPEMSRDPIFAFNADLGAHSNFHMLETTVRSDETCEYWWMDAVYPNGSKVRFACEEFRCGDRAGSVAPVPGQPALLRVEVLDESGAPQAFDAAAAVDVDGLLAMAYPGSPSLPAGYDLPPAPSANIDPIELSVGNNGAVMATDAGASSPGCGCSSVRTDSSPLGAALAVLGLLGFVAVRRRRR